MRQSLCENPVLTAPASRGPPYLDESPRLEKEPRLAGAVKADFSHRLVSLGFLPLPHQPDAYAWGYTGVIDVPRKALASLIAPSSTRFLET